MTTTRPEPTSTLTPDNDTNAYSDKRTYRWLFDTNQPGKRDGVRSLQIEVSHSKYSKRFEVEARAVDHTPISITVEFAFGDSYDPYLLRQPAPRYSRKVLDALAAEWFEKFPEHLTGEAATLWAGITAAREVPVSA
jgi:hypothetical protein